MDVSFCAAAQIEALKVFFWQFLLAKELEILSMREKTRVETRNAYCWLTANTTDVDGGF